MTELDRAARAERRKRAVQDLMDEFPSARSMGIEQLTALLDEAETEAVDLGFTTTDLLRRFVRLRFLIEGVPVSEALSAAVLKTLNSVEDDPDTRLRFIEIQLPSSREGSRDEDRPPP